MYISITNTHWKKLTIPKETSIPPPKVKIQKIQLKPYQEVIRNKSHLEEEKNTKDVKLEHVIGILHNYHEITCNSILLIMQPTTHNQHD